MKAALFLNTRHQTASPGVNLTSHLQQFSPPQQFHSLNNSHPDNFPSTILTPTISTRQFPLDNSPSTISPRQFPLDNSRAVSLLKTDKTPLMG